MTTIANRYTVIICNIIFTKNRVSNTTINHSYLGIIPNMHNIRVCLLAHKIRFYRSASSHNNTTRASNRHFTSDSNSVTDNDFIKRRGFSSTTSSYRRSDIRKITDMHTITRCTYIIRYRFIIRTAITANYTTSNRHICANTDSIKIRGRFNRCTSLNITTISTCADLNIITNHHFIMIRFFFSRKTAINS